MVFILDWDQKLQQTVEMFLLKLANATYGEISGMVNILGDGFIKIITHKATRYIYCLSATIDHPCAHVKRICCMILALVT